MEWPLTYCHLQLILQFNLCRANYMLKTFCINTLCLHYAEVYALKFFIIKIIWVQC